MTARQSHGFKLEEFLEDRFDELDLEDDYTSRNDGKFSLLGCEVECSIKNTKTKGEMCMGDYMRIVDSQTPVLLFAGSYESRRNLTDIIRVLYFPIGLGDICGPQPDVLFFAEDYKAYMVGHWQDGTPFDYSGYNIDMRYAFQSPQNNIAWKLDRSTFDDRFGKICSGYDVYIHPRPKRSRKQRRLQCAIPRRYHESLFSEYCVAEIERESFHDDIAWRWTTLEIAMGIEGRTGELGLPQDIAAEVEAPFPFYVPALFDSQGCPYAIFDTCWTECSSAIYMASLARDERIGVVSIDVDDGDACLGYSFMDAYGNTAACFHGKDGRKLSGAFSTREAAMDAAYEVGAYHPMACSLQSVC